MTTPTVNDFSVSDGTLRTKADWNTLIQEIVNYVGNGLIDFNVLSITAGTYKNLPSAALGLEAGEALAERDALILKESDGKLYKADNTAAATADFFMGFANAAYASGSTVVIERDFKTGFTGLTAEKEYFMATAGTITDTIPSSGFIKKVGFAITTTKLEVYQDQRLADQQRIGGVLFIDSQNRNLGINQSTMADWASTLTAVQIGGIASISSVTTAAAGNNFSISNNAKYDQTDTRWEYLFASSEEASQIDQINGTIALRVAAAGTAGGAITWIPGVFVKADGAVGIGTVSPGSFAADIGGALNVQGDITLTGDMSGAINFTGAITTDSTIDGRDVAADGSTLDTLNTAVGGITVAEADQIENIGITTISAAQWVYLGALDQSLITTDSPTFANVNVTTNCTVGPSGNQAILSSKQLKLTSSPSTGSDTVLIAINTGSGFSGISCQGTDPNFRITGNLEADTIVTASNANVTMTPNGTGIVVSSPSIKLGDGTGDSGHGLSANTYAGTISNTANDRVFVGSGTNGVGMGMAIISTNSQEVSAIFTLDYDSTSLVFDGGGLWSVTKTTSAKFNFYYDTNGFYLENLTGADRAMTVQFIGPGAMGT